jgi:hypothetical protein
MLLALGLVTALAVLAGIAAQLAVAQTPVAPPLPIEHLAASEGFIGQAGTIDIQADCTPANGRPTISYKATGPALGPYPGTYSETGIATLERVMQANIGVPLIAFQAQFAIDSPVGRVTGTKHLVLDPTNYGICNTDTSLGFPVGIHVAQMYETSYTATITTATATCTTQGTSRVDVAEQHAPAHPNVHYHRFDQFFLTGTTPLCTVAPARPTSKNQCKNGGWRRFRNPSFKNQGQCVKFVNHHNGKGKDKAKKKGHGKKK